MNWFKDNLGAIKRLYKESLYSFIGEEEMIQHMKIICDADQAIFEKKLGNKSDVFESSKSRKILQLHERILFAKELDEIYRNKKKEKVNPYYLYPQNATYLVLTGFDLLGQRNGWLDFKSWLKSKKKNHVEEKEQEIQNFSSIEDKSTFINEAEKLHSGYVKIYGVRNSFYNFIDSVIPKEYQTNLFNEVKAIRFPNYPKLTPSIMGDEVDKKNWLYKTRNKFTHSVYSNESYFHPSVDKDGKNWFYRGDLYSNGKTRIEVTENFKPTLYDATLAGMTEYIKINS